MLALPILLLSFMALRINANSPFLLAYFDMEVAKFRSYPALDYDRTIPLAAPKTVEPVHFDMFVRYYEMKPLAKHLQRVLHFKCSQRIEKLHQKIIEIVNNEEYTTADVYRLEEELASLIQQVASEPIMKRFPTTAWIVAESITFAVIPKYFFRDDRRVVIQHRITDFCHAIRKERASSRQLQLVDGESVGVDCISGLPSEIYGLIADKLSQFWVMMRLLNRRLLHAADLMELVRGYHQSRLPHLSTFALPPLFDSLTPGSDFFEEAPILLAITVLFNLQNNKIRSNLLPIITKRLHDMKATGVLRYFARMASGMAPCDERVKKAIRYCLIPYLYGKGVKNLQLMSTDATWKRCKHLNKY